MRNAAICKVGFLRVLVITLVLSLVMAVLIFSSVSAEGSRVFDQAGLYSEQEAVQLEQRIAELRTALALDIVIVTTDDAEGKTSRAYADDFYDYGGFGVGSDYDGLLLLINMDDREVYISTCGIAIDYFTDSRIDSILDNVTPHLGNADYFSAGTAFLADVSKYVSAGIPEGQYRIDESELGFGGRLARSFANSPVYILISVLIAAVVVLIMAARNRGIKKTTPTTYLDTSTLKVLNSRDTLTNTFVSKTKISSSSSSSSGSSGGSRSTTHRSSSGRTHGGGGRKF